MDQPSGSGEAARRGCDEEARRATELEASRGAVGLAQQEVTTREAERLRLERDELVVRADLEADEALLALLDELDQVLERT